MLGDSQQRALEFRTTFGLDPDDILIVAAEKDPSYSSANYGVPLSVAEESELQRRVQLELDSHAAVDLAAKQPTWGGYFIDQHSQGAPVFMFTADEESMKDDLQRLLPKDSGFRTIRVEHTLADLQRVKDSIVAAWDELRADGIKVTHTGIDLIGNAVTVGIDGLTDEATAKIVGRFGPNIKFRDAPPAEGDACPHSSCRPFKGGMDIVGAFGHACTSGFIVRRDQHGAPLSIVTAGHCIWVNGQANSLNKRWYHLTGTTKDWFGDSKYHTFFNNSNADVGLIELDPDEFPAQANKLYINNGSSGAIYTVTNWINSSYQTVGSQACAYGAYSNNSACVTIVDADEDNFSCVLNNTVCYTIRHTKEYGYNLIDGDSGGPIYQVGSSTNRYALGTHVHSQSGGGSGIGWYSTYFDGRVAYGAASGGVDDYVICITASC